MRYTAVALSVITLVILLSTQDRFREKRRGPVVIVDGEQLELNAQDPLIYNDENSQGDFGGENNTERNSDAVKEDNGPEEKKKDGDNWIVKGEIPSPDQVIRSRSQIAPPNGDGENSGVLYGVDWKLRLNLSVEGDMFHPMSEFLNPCWREALPCRDPYAGHKEYCHMGGVPRFCNRLTGIYTKRWDSGDKTRIRCLPYFYFAGVSKAGTTDLKFQMDKHPDVLRPAISEINWWNRRRQGHRKRFYARFGEATFDEYLDLFDQNALDIDKSTQLIEGKTWHPHVTYDGSSQLFWDHDGWEVIPDNVGHDEPKVTLIDSLHRLTPDAKVIVLLRDPVERLFSHYCMLKRSRANAKHFHDGAAYGVKKMNDCLKAYTIRKCIFDTALFDDIFRKQITLRTSMYAPFYAEWAKVFKPENILILKSEEYYANRLNTLNQIYAFLGLRSLQGGGGADMTDDMLDPLEGKATSSINSAAPKFQRKNKPKMLDSTRTMLKEFYRPYNEELAKTLNNDKFLWL